MGQLYKQQATVTALPIYSWKHGSISNTGISILYPPSPQLLHSALYEKACSLIS